MSKTKKILQRVKKCVGLDKRGAEICDPTPMSVPVGYRKPPTIQEQIKMAFRSQRLLDEQFNGKETFEDADDFDIGDDFDPNSPYEMDFDHENALGYNNSEWKDEKPEQQENKPMESSSENSKADNNADSGGSNEQDNIKSNN